MQQIDYDIIIIGGGINGAGIARDLGYQNNYRVCLIEQSDFASATSSNSSKLAHGGLRYLEQGHFKLIYQACHERQLLYQQAPHLVKEIPFVYPIYSHSKRPKWQVNIGLTIYDWLSGKHRGTPHYMISKEEVLDYHPHLNKESLIGGAVYYDGQMNDSRLVIESLLDASNAGVDIYNYKKVTNININNKTTLEITDQLTQETVSLTAKYIINTTGPFSDTLLNIAYPNHAPLLRLSKGIHLIINSFTPSHAVILPTSDNRHFFVIPWENKTLVGTTDTDYKGPISPVTITDEDRHYLLEETNTHFPSLNLSTSDIISEFAGVRPLIKQSSKSPSSVSREHQIIENGPIISLIGGKYTTFRKMSEDITRLICKKTNKKYKQTTKVKTYYGGNIDLTPNTIRKKYTPDIQALLTEEQFIHLYSHYGSAYTDILSILKENQSYCQAIGTTPHLQGEVIYAVKKEFCKTSDDFLRRRTHIQLTDSNWESYVPIINSLIKKAHAKI